jgi:hypothetical protein
MKIICDTNIWYEFAKTPPNEKLYVENDLISTFISIDELSKTYNILKNLDLVKETTRAIFNYSEKRRNAIYDPPLVYLKKLSDPNFVYDTYNKHKASFLFTEKIAQGVILTDQDKIIIEKYCQEREEKIKLFTDIFNERATVIKAKIKNKKKHREAFSWELNKEFINFLVASYTNTEGLDNNFDWSQITLFQKVLKIYFNDLELGARKMQINDVNDLFLLMYVKPNDKFWTKENKWIKYIKAASLDEYIYEPNR